MHGRGLLSCEALHVSVRNMHACILSHLSQPHRPRSRLGSNSARGGCHGLRLALPCPPARPGWPSLCSCSPKLSLQPQTWLARAAAPTSSPPSQARDTAEPVAAACGRVAEDLSAPSDDIYLLPTSLEGPDITSHHLSKTQDMYAAMHVTCHLSIYLAIYLYLSRLAWRTCACQPWRNQFAPPRPRPRPAVRLHTYTRNYHVATT